MLGLGLGLGNIEDGGAKSSPTVCSSMRLYGLTAKHRTKVWTACHQQFRTHTVRAPHAWRFLAL